MKRWLVVLAALVVGCSPAELGQEEAARSAQVADRATATAERAQDVIYVDVRTPREYAAGHVEGAINIPHDQLSQRWQELEQYRGGEKEIVLYCRSGRRSGIAHDILERQGFENIENGGGLRDLMAEGVAVTR